MSLNYDKIKRSLGQGGGFWKYYGIVMTVAAVALGILYGTTVVKATSVQRSERDLADRTKKEISDLKAKLNAAHAQLQQMASAGGQNQKQEQERAQAEAQMSKNMTEIASISQAMEGAAAEIKKKKGAQRKKAEMEFAKLKGQASQQIAMLKSQNDQLAKVASARNPASEGDAKALATRVEASLARQGMKAQVNPETGEVTVARGAKRKGK